MFSEEEEKVKMETKLDVAVFTAGIFTFRKVLWVPPPRPPPAPHCPTCPAHARGGRQFGILPPLGWAFPPSAASQVLSVRLALRLFSCWGVGAPES